MASQALRESQVRLLPILEKEMKYKIVMKKKKLRFPTQNQKNFVPPTLPEDVPVVSEKAHKDYWAVIHQVVGLIGK